jgi:4-hydroxythreonine-4-phosphate dehydrogenase
MPTSPSGRVLQKPNPNFVRLAVTLGDPAGVGPEVTLKVLARSNKILKLNPLLIGPASFYRKLAKKMRLSISFKDFSKNLSFGKSDSALTRLAVLSIELAAALAMQNKIEGIVTPPINKAGLKKAHFDIPGHTEYLAGLSKTKRFEMMLVGGPLRVVLVTRHMALKKAAETISKKRVKEAILLTDFELRRSFGIKNPRLGVCSLNPHAGEEGLLGREEIEKIIPAVQEAGKNIKGKISGPKSPDILFYEAYEGHFDAQICMYHDQGLIPLKMISRGHGVNVTLGLPFVRTSPDHGTAYDIAGRFTANPGSMEEALSLAVSLCKNRKRYSQSALTYRRS